MSKNTSFKFNKDWHTSSGLAFTHTKGYKNNKIPTAFAAVLKLIPETQVKEYDDKIVDGKFGGSLGSDVYTFEQKLAEALKKLVVEIEAGIQASYDTGKEDGKKALILLTTGEITLQDFEKK